MSQPPTVEPVGSSPQPGESSTQPREVPHDSEQHLGEVNSRLNWLRAGVLGANDGIISVAGIVIGIAGATTNQRLILLTGLLGLAAGAFSMAVGEYVSVSTQRDTEQALLAKERWELEHLPEEELRELASIYQAKGLTPELAHEVAVQLTEHDAFGAHVAAELGIDPDALTNPWHAALASMVSFTVGAVLPILAGVLPPPTARIPVVLAAVLVALAITGTVSARLGGAPTARALMRLIGWGAVAMAATYVIGHLVGTGPTG